MKKGLLELTTITFRAIAITVLLSLVVASVILCATAMLNPNVHLFGRNVVGATRLDYSWDTGAVVFDYSTGWSGTPAADGEVCNLPGLSIDRTIVTLTGDTRGDAILLIRLQWWLLLLANLPPLVLVFLLARPLLKRRRIARGRCPACGYDLRATPDRCPECGAVPSVSGATPA